MIKKRLKMMVIALLLLISLAAAGLWWFWDQPLLSPLSQGQVFQFLQPAVHENKNNKIIYGFLPYWNVSKVSLRPELTHLAYFSLTILGDGSIQTLLNGNAEPGYNRMSSERFLELYTQTKANQAQVELVLSQFDTEDIVSLLGSPTAQERLISSIDAALIAYPFTGINIDIEYSGEVTPQLQKQLTMLMTRLNQHLDQRYQGIQLSIDMYASAAEDTGLWQVGPLSEQVDFIVVMAYDFHRRSSPLAGPVAPIFGGDELWDSDISEHLRTFLSKFLALKSYSACLFMVMNGKQLQLTPRPPLFPIRAAPLVLNASSHYLLAATSSSFKKAGARWHCHRT